MIEHNFPFNSFIGGWYIPETICDSIIKVFNEQKNQARKGTVFSNGEKIVKPDFKESTDLAVMVDDDNHPFKDYKDCLQKCMVDYAKKYDDLNNIELIKLVDGYNIQYYKPNEGFKAWHFERMSKQTQHRVLVFQTFLNDVDDGGTEFKYQKLTVPAKKGLTLIWPGEWTHTHRGQISKTKEKYITTGWVGFNE